MNLLEIPKPDLSRGCNQNHKKYTQKYIDFLIKLRKIKTIDEVSKILKITNYSIIYIQNQYKKQCKLDNVEPVQFFRKRKYDSTFKL